VITPDSNTQIHGVSCFMLKARMIRMMPEAASDAPRMRVSSAAASRGFLECDKAGDDVEHAEQDPEPEFAPALDLKGAKYFRDAGNDHHHADDEDARDCGRRHAAKRDKPREQIDDAECNDPAPLGA
jgi:hypothetical protein